jgi:hypothetical protein
MAFRIGDSKSDSTPKNDKRSSAREAQHTIDEQLSRLEEDIRRLKVEFDIYFNGATKRPPYDTKNRIETTIKRLGDERHLAYAQRFRYNSLVARYTSFREMWRRAVQEREEGRDAVSLKQKAQLKTTASDNRAEQTSFVCSDAQNDVPTVKSIYNALIEAQKQCGTSRDDLTFARFHRIIAQQSDILKKQLNCERIRFSISVKDGRVSFKAEADKK